MVSSTINVNFLATWAQMWVWKLDSKTNFNNWQPWVTFRNCQSGVIWGKSLLHSISHGVKEPKPKENYTLNQMCKFLDYNLAATKERRSLWSSPSLSVNEPNVNPARLEQDFDRESGYRSTRFRPSLRIMAISHALTSHAKKNPPN